MKWIARAFALSALIGTTLAAAPAPVPVATSGSPTLDQLLAICTLPANAAEHSLAALPDNQRAAALLLCIGYAKGQSDLLRQLQGTPATRRAI